MTSTVTYLVEGMTCDHCVKSVTSELSGVAGVSDVSVDLGTKRAVVTGENLDDAALVAAIDEAGYDGVKEETA